MLSNGRCVEYCPKTSYFDSSSGGCKPCDSSCSACLGDGPAACSLCPDGSILKSGRCEAVTCAFATGLGICLDELILRVDRRWAAFVVLPVLLVVGLDGWWYVRRERRKTREATQAFADTLDDKTIRDRLTRLRLEKVFGLERIRTGATASPVVSQAEEIRKVKERKRLRDLLLPSSRRRRAGVENIEMGTKHKESKRDRLSAWIAPPPPYAPSKNPAASSSSTIATMHLVDPGTIRPTSIAKDKIISMSSPAPDASFSSESSLRPPPRPTARVPIEPESHVERHSLRQLWPALRDRDEVDRLDEIDLWGGSASGANGERASRMHHGLI